VGHIRSRMIRRGNYREQALKEEETSLKGVAE
jgi:hypothetical protein